MQTPPPELVKLVRERIEREGESKTARSLGLSRLATVKLAAGMPVLRGTVAAAVLALQKERSA